MKVFYLPVFFVVILSFIACDGQDRMHKAPQEVLLENKLLDSFSENITYIPKEYTEVVTDTILSNGFRIKIKYYTDMNNSILEEKTIDSIKHKNYYRDGIATIIVTKNSTELLNKTFTKSSFAQLENEIDTLQMGLIYINQQESLKENKASIYFPFCTIDTSHCLFYELSINNQGETDIKLVSNNNNFYH